MTSEELSKLTDEELERRIADSRPNSYVPSSVYHVYMAEQEKRKHQSILRALGEKKKNSGNKNSKRKIPSPVIKKLFALSRNSCAFPDCSFPLIDQRGIIIAEIAHIEAEKPGGARYNLNQTDSERFNYDNLILLCPNHHTLIDRDTQTYSAEALRNFKRDHEFGNNEVVLIVDYTVNHQDGGYHEYNLTVIVKNSSGKSINKPKLKITMPNDVIKVISSRGQKIKLGKSAEINFEELDVTVIHPGEQKKLMDTPNVGVFYFMNSDIEDNITIMNQVLKIELFADNFKPVIFAKKFSQMQQF